MDILADVIRLEVPTQAEITGGSPPAVKLKQQIHAKDTGNLYYKNSSGQLVLFFAAQNLSSQGSASLGSGLIGDVGIPGVTPDGGTSGGPGTVHNMLIGFKEYVTGVISNVGLANFFPAWTVDDPYSQNDIVTYVSLGGLRLAISNIPGEGTNTGINPEGNPESWTVYENTFPLAQVLTMILNTKANA